MPSERSVAAGQSEVAAWLADPANHGAGVDRVERIDTHGAMVFLAGDRAYKVKRAVRFPYMDFSSLELRRTACEREIALNRRTAPELYLAARPLRRHGATLSFEGDGEIVEWVVVMRRFDQDTLGDRLAETGRLSLELVRELADAIVAFHEAAEPLFGAAAAGGGAAGVRAVIEENGQELAGRPDLFGAGEVAAFNAASLAALERAAALLDRRLAAGLVRRCHGDLHLRNICLVEGRPTLFDAIEFNDAIACIDVLYDLAFLLMDLDHRGLRAHANLVLNRYLQGRDELAGLAAMPLFLSMRAAVRAKVGVSAASAQTDPAQARRLTDDARGYFQAACTYLAPAPPRLIAIGGLSGTGKTELARDLAPAIGAAPGAVHLRSDVVRKQQAGVAELKRLPESAYAPERSAAVYTELARRADTALRAGQAVVVDAVYARPAERAAIETVARALGVPFDGLWLEAPAPILLDRVAGRRGDASDATAEVLQRQLDYDLGEIAWQRIDAGGARAAVLAAARAAIARPANAPRPRP